jgi:hypothetical protein
VKAVDRSARAAILVVTLCALVETWVVGRVLRALLKRLGRHEQNTDPQVLTMQGLVPHAHG